MGDLIKTIIKWILVIIITILIIALIIHLANKGANKKNSQDVHSIESIKLDDSDGDSYLENSEDNNSTNSSSNNSNNTSSSNGNNGNNSNSSVGNNKSGNSNGNGTLIVGVSDTGAVDNVSVWVGIVTLCSSTYYIYKMKEKGSE